MEISVNLPLDDDGFLRRECPSCEREFKWFYGETAERPDDFLEPENYFCPYCGVSSDTDSWWTPQQLEYAQEAAAGPITEELADRLQRTLGNQRNSLIRLEVESGPAPEPPMPLVEQNDMTMIAPPCHSFEPLKVTENWTGSLHCLMCGQEFTV